MKRKNKKCWKCEKPCHEYYCRDCFLIKGSRRKNWLDRIHIVKYRNKDRGTLSCPRNFNFPKEMIGKRIKISIEIIDDKNYDLYRFLYKYYRKRDEKQNQV